MKFDTQKYSYASRRTVSFAKNGMVATSSPLPAQVGLDVLKKGGNAIDAAVATAAALSVIEPTSNGIGADSFALIWYKGKLYGLNGSGRSPRLISGEKLLEKGLKAVPSLSLIHILTTAASQPTSGTTANTDTIATTMEMIASARVLHSLSSWRMLMLVPMWNTRP